MNLPYAHVNNGRHWPRITAKAFLVLSFFLASWNVLSTFLAGKTFYVPKRIQNVFDRNLESFYVINVMPNDHSKLTSGSLRQLQRKVTMEEQGLDINSIEEIDIINLQKSTINESITTIKMIKKNSWREEDSREVVQDVVEDRPDELEKDHGTRAMSCDGCFRTNLDFVIKSEVCKNNVSLKIVFLINSGAQNWKQRDALRKTWLSRIRRDLNMAYVFVVGNRNVTGVSLDKEIAREQMKYQDLLVLNLLDVYSHLTYKTMAALQWVVQSCSHAQYVMKVDDDVWVNKDNLLYLLTARLDMRKKFQFGGKCEYGQRPHRDPLSKYYVSYEQYPGTLFPPFCSGTAYISKMATVQNIVNVSPNIPFFHLEDIYLALCLSELRVPLTKLPGFYNSKVPLLSCKYSSREVITSHELTPRDLAFIWNDISCNFFRKNVQRKIWQTREPSVDPKWSKISQQLFEKSAKRLKMKFRAV